MSFDFGFYWAVLLRRLPVMALFALLFSGMGVFAALQLPDVYSTSARLLVEEPLIPDNMVASTVQSSAIEQLAVIEQRLLTRANLIDIANRYDVFEDIRQMAPDTVVARMRAATDISRPRAGRSGDRATLMTIGFESHSPQIAADVVNEYVTLVLQENARFRASRAENTLEFFEQEVERLNAELDQQSAEIAQFKAENANALPEDQAFRIGRQTLLQERLAQFERDLSALAQRRQSVVDAYETAQAQQTPTPTAQQRSSYEEELIIAEADLENLRSEYSDDNPRIFRLEERIDRLRTIIAAQNEANGVAVGEEERASAQEALLEATLADIDSEIETLQTARDTTSADLDRLLENISRSAANALRITELERDYTNMQARYNSAVSNLNTARLSERLEATSQGQRISVIENASVPRVPSGPNRTAIAAGAVALGVGLAVGYFILLEVLNRYIRRPAELKERCATTPIATIPYMESWGERLIRRTGLVAAMLAVLIAVPAGLWYVDTYYLPLELIVQRGLDRLGLG